MRKELHLTDRAAPAGSKVSEKARTGGVGQNNPAQVFLSVGTFFSEAEFVGRPTAIVFHPFDKLGEVSVCDLCTIFEVLSLGPKGLAAVRAAEFVHWERLAANVTDSEECLHQALAEWPQFILMEKRLLLF